jgi:hypothetical protein
MVAWYEEGPCPSRHLKPVSRVYAHVEMPELGKGLNVETLTAGKGGRG